MTVAVENLLPATGMEDKNMKNETRNDEAVSPVIATILMVAITVVLAGVLYVWAANLAESNTDGDLALYSFSGADGAGADEVVVTMDQGGDLGWASAKIKVAIGQAAAVTAEACNANSDNTPCYDESGSAWTVGDAVTITTQGCGTDDSGAAVSTCTVTVTILNDRDGVTLDTSSIAME
jgi:flagellin-like protein